MAVVMEVSEETVVVEMSAACQRHLHHVVELVEAEVPLEVMPMVVNSPMVESEVVEVPAVEPEVKV